MKLGVDLDAIMGRHFLSGLRDRAPGTWEIHRLERDAGVVPVLDVYVTDEGGRERYEAERTVVLTREPATGPRAVCCFQRFSQVYMALLSAAGEILRGPGGQACGLVGVSAPGCGRTGTAAALAVAGLLGEEEGKRTLFCSLGSLDLNDALLAGPMDQGFSRLLMQYRKQQRIDASCFAYQHDQEFYFLPSPENYREKECLDAGMLPGFLSALRASGLFDAVVVQAPDTLDDRALALLGICDVSLVFQRTDPYGRIAAGEYLRQLENLGEQALVAGLVRVDLAVGDPGSRADGRKDGDAAIRFPPDGRLYVQSPAGPLFDPAREAVASLRELRSTILERMMGFE